MSSAAGKPVAVDGIAGEGRPVLHAYPNELLAMGAEVVAPRDVVADDQHRVRRRLGPAAPQEERDQEHRERDALRRTGPDPVGALRHGSVSGYSTAPNPSAAAR
jgi:hypothetical protein